jgi:serine/threonine-protein kinase HipA
MGQLHRSMVRGEEVLSFEYDKDWLGQARPFLLDPRLQFVEGRQYADGTNPFGLFLDSAPDRWGRLLIRRRAALESGDAAAVLFDSDYLLAVSDTCRMGALRFRDGADGPKFEALEDLIPWTQNEMSKEAQPATAGIP